MNNFLVSLSLAAATAFTHAKLITMPPVTTTGEDVAIIWIQGAMCTNTGYEAIAAEVQKQGATLNQRIWVGLPDFLGNTPDPAALPGKVTETLDALRALGFTGDNIVMAGHSLGGVTVQGYSNTHSDTVKAQVLMGAVLTRDTK